MISTWNWMLQAKTWLMRARLHRTTEVDGNSKDYMRKLFRHRLKIIEINFNIGMGKFLISTSEVRQPIMARHERYAEG
jgi:hypothetical protein